MKLRSLLAAFMLCCNLSPPATASATPGAVSDEFDGAANTPPDPSLWGYDTGGGWSELQTYTSSTDNVYQDGSGHLVIKATQNPDGGYTSGRIKTQNKLTIGYGRVEASIQMPPGPGILPAFWLLGSDYPSIGHPQCGEIDIIEYVQSAFHFTLHGPQQGEADYRPRGAGEHTGVSDSQAPAFDPSAGFHTYWVERSPNLVTIGVDGTTTAVFTPNTLPAGATWVFNDKPMFAIINFAVGGDWAGTPPAHTPFPQQMVIDWFRYTPWEQ
jgi:beta-glucanase (GH16 family)